MAGDGAGADGFGPGVYAVIHDNAAVKASVELSSAIVGRLKTGDSVLVLETTYCHENGRLRGRLSSPAGWMTLLEAQSGYRFAVLSSSLGEQRARLIRDVVDSESKLEALQERVEHLRQAHHVRMQTFHERAAELEARFLSGSLEPTRSIPPVARAIDHHGGGRPHYHHDVVKNTEYHSDPTVPPGAEVVVEKRIVLTREQERRLAVYPPEPPMTEEEKKKAKEAQASGKYVLSNAMFHPSLNHAQLDSLPPGVHPLTRPPRQAMGEDFLAPRAPPLPLPEEYRYDVPGAWRYTAIGGCPLALDHVEMVEDEYRGRAVNPHPVFRSALPPPRA